MFVDSHSHLTAIKGLEKVIQKALEDNVKFMASCSEDLESSLMTLKIAEKFDSVIPCLGFHPQNVKPGKEKEIEKEILKIIDLINENKEKVKALGETGLDFSGKKSFEEKCLQEKLFKSFLSLGVKLNKPVIVHSRFAQKQCLEIVKEFKVRILMHWFFDSRKLVERAVSQGLMISVGPAILYSKEKEAVVKEIPLENLLLETDSPVSFNKVKASPSMVLKVAEKISEIKGLSLQEVEEKTSNNAIAFYNLSVKE
ncbi:MAG: TatD family hydrolase [archaeon]